MSQYFPTPSLDYKNIKVEIDLSNYATKKEIYDITYVDTSNFALKINLANLKTEIDKLDFGNLTTVSVDLSKLSNIVKNDVIKKTVYDKLVAKVNKINTSDFVLKTNFNTKLTGLENKIPNTNGLVKKTYYNTKITEIENKIPDVSGLATKTALTTVENKIPSITNLATKTALTTVENKIHSITGLVKKTGYNTKITDIENILNNHNHDKYVATSEFNTLAANVFNARLAQANVITKTDFDAKLSSLNRKITANKTKHFLNDNDLSYYRGNILMKEVVNKII